jgi:hypothetical protein
MVEKFGKGGALIVGASALFVISLFLPWFKIEFFITQTMSGFEQEGYLFLVLFAYPLYSVLANKPLHQLGGYISSGAAVVFMLVYMFTGDEMLGETITRFDFAAFGLYLGFLATIGLVAGVYLKSKEA